MKLDSSRRNALAEATDLYASNLSVVAPYLEDRGIPEEVAAAFRLGYVAEPYSTDQEIYRGRLVIPYLTRAGVVTMRFRCLEPHDCKATGCPKYLSLPKVELPLYNVASLFTTSDVLVITEGELDAVVCSAMVGSPAIGCPGASLWKPHFSLCVADFQTVLVCGDGDEAGAEMVDKVTHSVYNARGVKMPPGEDLSSVFLESGREGVRRLLGLE